MWSALCVSARTGQPLNNFYPLARALRPDNAGLTDRALWERACQDCYDAALPEEPVTAAASRVAKSPMVASATR